MQRKVVALSRCLETSPKFHRFHFKGAYLGHSISEINLYVKDNKFTFDKGVDYLLYINIMTIRKGRLIGGLIKYKRI